MDITLGVIADYANVSQGGKLNVMGIFDTILATEFPVRHPIITLIIKIQAGPTDSTKIKRDLELKLVDEDSQEVLSLSGHFDFQHSPSGELGSTTSILVIQDLVFLKPGNFSFKIFLSNEFKTEIPLKLKKITVPA